MGPESNIGGMVGCGYPSHCTYSLWVIYLSQDHYHQVQLILAAHLSSSLTGKVDPLFSHVCHLFTLAFVAVTSLFAELAPWQPTWLSAQMPLRPPFGGHRNLWASFIRAISRAQKNLSRLCQFIPCRTTKFTQKWPCPEYRWDLEPRSLFPYVLPILIIL